MKIVSTTADAHALSSDRKRVLVPTMGALHRGHLELIRAARAWAGKDGEVTVSIFVNPLQFEPGSDFERYPRPEGDDEQLCGSAGVDVIFRPDASEMYAADRSVYVEETSLSETLCGRSRPGHFRGVCTVVAKLFNALQPHAAVFGEKDFQQLAIIRRMVRDLNFATEIIPVPTVRESDGLALSSRNRYLTAAQREEATVLRKASLAARDLFERGETSPAKIVARAREMIGTGADVVVDYVEIVDADSLQPVKSIARGAVFALAVSFGKTRLIDNIRLA